MKEQERKIIRLILNEMAFEGARNLYEEADPDIPRKLFCDLKRIGLPEIFTKSKVYVPRTDVDFDDNKSVYENCYWSLRYIRNNLIHANKAYCVDTAERLEDLLNWAEEFIDSVYETKSDFSKCAQDIKNKLKIESF